MCDWFAHTSRRGRRRIGVGTHRGDPSQPERSVDRLISKRQVEYPVQQVALLARASEQIEILDRVTDWEALRDEHEPGKRKTLIESFVGEAGHRVDVVRQHDEIESRRPFEDLRVGSPTQSYITYPNDGIEIATPPPSAKDRLTEVGVSGEPRTPWH